MEWTGILNVFLLSLHLHASVFIYTNIFFFLLFLILDDFSHYGELVNLNEISESWPQNQFRQGHFDGRKSKQKQNNKIRSPDRKFWTAELDFQSSELQKLSVINVHQWWFSKIIRQIVTPVHQWASSFVNLESGSVAPTNWEAKLIWSVT